MDRSDAWSAYQASVAEVSSAWNTVAPLHSAFELTNTQHEEQLRNVNNFIVSSGHGNTHSAANQQPAGRTGGTNSVSVGDLFSGHTVGTHRVSSGTDLDISSRAQRGIDRASGQVNAEMEAVRAADSALATAVGEVRTAAANVNAKENGVTQAIATVTRRQAETARDDATGRVASVNSEIAAAKRTLKDVMNIVKDVAGVVSFAVAPAAAAGAAAPSATARAASGVGAVSGSSAVESIANRIIDAAYADRLNAAKAALATAAAALRSAVTAENSAILATADAELQTALSNYDTKKLAVPGMLATRRAAYEAMANAAARRSGAPRGSRAYNEVRGAIAAVPIVDTLVSKCESAKNAARTPAYNARSGEGLGIANYHNLAHAREFTWHLAWTKGFKDLYDNRFTHWNERKASLQTVIARLSGNNPDL